MGLREGFASELSGTRLFFHVDVQMLIEGGLLMFTRLNALGESEGTRPSSVGRK